MPRPYQPSLLRLLHGITALLVPLAWLSGLVVYSTHDGRFGRLPVTIPGEWIDIHGSVGVLLWPVALLFVLYALTVGRPRLRHPGNAIALLALIMAIVTGKLMQEDWLRSGELNQPVYGLHLLAWLGIALAVTLHITSVLGRGGLPLARSMGSLQMREGDLPAQWFGQIRRGLRFRR
jgi:hypothetical protein